MFTDSTSKQHNTKVGISGADPRGGGGSAWGRGAEYVGWGQPGALQLPSCPELGLFRSLDGQRAAQEERRMWWVRRT